MSSHLLSRLIFVATVAVVILSLVSVVFPALFLDLTSSYENEVDGFEMGPYAVPLIVFNIIIISFIFLYYTKKLPTKIYDTINRILERDIPFLPSTAIVVFIIFSYIGLTASELTLNEGDFWKDFVIVENALEVWPFGDPHFGSIDVYVEEQLSRHVRMFLFFVSLELFGNIKILPFVSSVLLVLVTYFVTVKISQKRLAGIIAMLVLVQSHTFRLFDTVAVYENFWSLFYILSLYTVYKKWYFSPITYILSIFSKAFVITYFPMSLFFILRAGIVKRKKILLLISYIAVIVVAFVTFSLEDSVYTQVLKFDQSEFFPGFSALVQQLRFDHVIIFGILPLTILLYQKARKGLLEADSIQVLLFGAIIGTPILAMLTDFYYIHPYRFVPLIVFFAMGIGLLVSKKSIQQVS